jgi:hypothetical protein
VLKYISPAAGELKLDEALGTRILVASIKKVDPSTISLLFRSRFALSDGLASASSVEEAPKSISP